MDVERKIDEQDLVSLADQATRVVPEYEIDRSELITLIETAKSSIDEKYIKSDLEETEREKQVAKFINENSQMISLRDIDANDTESKRKQDIFQFSKVYAENNNKIQEDYAKHIIDLKEKLKNVTLDAVRELPNITTYTINKNDSREKIEKTENTALISINDTEQIEKNIKLLGLENKDIHKLSIKTLLTLDKEYTKEINNTYGMIGLTDAVERKKDKQELMSVKPNQIDVEASRSKNKETKRQRRKLGSTMQKPHSNKKRKIKEEIVY